VEYEGTYPLPEAQKDRFMLKIHMEPPTREDEITLAQRMIDETSPETTLASGAVQSVISADDLLRLRHALNGILIRPDILGYMVDLVRGTRHHDTVLIGAGPRATQSLLLASQAQAALSGRDFVTPDDIKRMALPVFEHRLILRPEYEIEGLTTEEVIGKILEQVAVPR
jgi:MoxR-like ATPase